MREHRSLLVLILLAVLAAGGVSVSSPAAAQESPTASASPSASCPAPSPSDSPTPSPSDSPTASLSGSSTPSSSACPSPSSDPSPSASPSSSPDASSTPSERVRHGGSLAGQRDKRLRHAEGRRHRRERSWKGWAPDPRWGTYGTAVLDRAARRARRGGWTEHRIAERIYAPFIVEGPATWSDSWGAPRWTGGYHPHHGQDVLCAYGASVIAAEAGTIRFGTDTLGGKVAYIDRDDGGFWYYAHLRSYARHLSSGDRVTAGRIIGRCGATGDASVPHVHFCLFAGDGRAIDPMRTLIRRLHTAERRLPKRQHREPMADTTPRVRSPRVTARVGSNGLSESVLGIEPIGGEGLAFTRQMALGTAAFMLLFGVTYWGPPSIRRRRGSGATTDRRPWTRPERARNDHRRPKRTG
jgi:murein DD-endopeptidase MepM/ murein hydrolase activator NlpD